MLQKHFINKLLTIIILYTFFREYQGWEFSLDLQFSVGVQFSLCQFYFHYLQKNKIVKENFKSSSLLILAVDHNCS